MVARDRVAVPNQAEHLGGFNDGFAAEREPAASPQKAFHRYTFNREPR